MRVIRLRPAEYGNSLLELLAVIALGALLVLGVTAIADSTMDETRRQHTAAYHALLTGATANYMRDHQRALVKIVAPSANAYALSPSTLRDQGYLPPSFADTNSYLQTSCILLVSDGAQLDALVVTEGGNVIEDRDIAHIAALVGPGGGYLGHQIGGTATEAIGAEGSWSLKGADLSHFTNSKCSTTAASSGHLASALHATGASADKTDGEFFAREPTPDDLLLNQLETQLSLGNAAVVADGSACGTDPATNAALAVNTNRDIVSCGVTGFWQTGNPWKKPVATYADLPTTANPGDVTLTLDTMRAYSRIGTDWVALAADQTGNLKISSKLSANIAKIGNNMEVGTNLKVGGDMNVMGGPAKKGTGEVNANGIESKDFTIAPSYTFGNRIAVAGNSCQLDANDAQRTSAKKAAAAGLIVSDANGITMVCHTPDNLYRYQNGTFTP